MQSVTHSQTGSRLFWLRLCVLVAGYLLALFGALSLLSVPLQMSFLYLIAGAVLVVFSFRDAPAMTWRSRLILVIGALVIFGILSFFGDARVRHWRPHPAGYIPAWFGMFHAVRQIRYVFSRHVSATNHDA